MRHRCIQTCREHTQPLAHPVHFLMLLYRYLCVLVVISSAHLRVTRCQHGALIDSIDASLLLLLLLLMLLLMDHR